MKGLVFLLAVAMFSGRGLTAAENEGAAQKKPSLTDFTAATECGECHQDIYDQWTQSMHSKGLNDPIFRSVIDDLAKETGDVGTITLCLRCHAPIAGVSGELDNLSIPVAWEDFSEIEAEGTTCDFCHTISGNEDLGKNISVGAYKYPHRMTSAIKYGRNPDADNSDHPTATSAFLTSSELCAVCHKFRHTVTGEELQNTYQEWLRSPYSKIGTRCQDCHMPSYAGSTTDEGKPREEVHAHVFIGGHQKIFMTVANVTVRGTVKKKEAGSQLTVTTSVRNTGAGHAIPTGVPGLREMRLIVKVFGQEGAMLGEETFSFGHRLVKKDGSHGFPWEAVRISEDTRIQPSEARRNSFDLTLPAGSEGVEGTVTIQAQLFYLLLTERMSERLNIELPKPILMTSVEKTVSVN